MSEEYRVWFNGELKDFDECRVSVRSHALHYGTSVFEGIRCYAAADGPRVFRLSDHLRRLAWSAAVYRLPMPWSTQELHRACRDTVRDSGLESAYIRPIVFRGDCGLGAIPSDLERVDVAIMVADWGAFFGSDIRKEGVDVCVTSWQRVAPNTIPAGVKAGGNYLSSFLVGMEARDRGFTEGIALGADGLVSEGSGDNVFVVRDGRILTPPAAASILSGITRDTVLHLARDLGLEIREQSLSREQLYAADELFLTGTAVEITPVRRVDHMPIGDGGPGPLTTKLQAAFFGLFEEPASDTRGWLEPL